MRALLLVAALVASSDSDLGERAYREGRWAEALAAFERALDAPGEPRRGAILHSMGNCALRLERPAEALRQYLRAERRLPRDADVAHDRRVAEGLLRLDGGDERDGSLLEAVERASSPSERLAVVSGLLAIGLVGSVLARRKPASWRIAAAAAVALGLAGAARLAATAWLSRPAEEAVVVESRVDLRSAPEESAPVTGTLRAGERVRVTEFGPRFLRVERLDGASAWAERAGLGLVD